ncbi:hypothetical protein ACHQM5_021222 [Ranunculus cassubicifolius]
MSETTGKKKKGSVSSECVVFSDDLISEVLIRLPMKDLYRCKCVCKSWKNMVSQHKFLYDFIVRAKSLPALLTGVFYEKDTCENGQIEDMVTEFLDFGTLNTLPVNILFSFLKRNILTVAAHDGFVLFAERPENPTGFDNCSFRFNYIVCNPLTKQCVDLPRPTRLHDLKTTFLHCYNTKGSGNQQIEFKVVSLLFEWPSTNKSRVEVYSSETGKWKSSSIFHTELRSSHIAVMFNECIYFWEKTHLFVYAVMEETMRKVELPTYNAGYGCLGVSDGSLYFARTLISSFLVYVLADGARWDLVHKVKFASFATTFPDTVNLHKLFMPFGFHPLNHNLVLVQSSRGMMLYDIGTGKIKLIGDFRAKSFYPVISYSLPAWLHFLPNTLNHAGPAASAGKRARRKIQNY